MSVRKSTGALEPQHEHMGERPTSRPNSGGKRVPMVLPKAPMGDEVAHRILMNSSYVPVKRFDSADYFLQQWEAKQTQQRLQEEEEEQRQGHGPQDDLMDSQTNRSASATGVSELMAPPAPVLRSPESSGMTE